ncbi:MAG: hypothetical protein A2W66_12895 [Deltaproteobacteria bacterium RIFCSPLOWO2_02_56_12]|nr:MAG: hypothetical protein A2W66_12895 [Deltaproteobacteria bacterium RIFCSPLOWO2_02_56_12]
MCLFQTLKSEQIFLQTGDKSLQFCDSRLFLVIYENGWVGKPRRTGRSFLRKHLKPGQCRSMLIRGVDPGRTIADLARRSRASMIIMGSHGRTGLQRLMLGSIAERTLRYAKCPVLIVKK